MKENDQNIKKIALKEKIKIQIVNVKEKKFYKKKLHLLIKTIYYKKSESINLFFIYINKYERFT